MRFKNVTGTGGSRTQQVYESQLFTNFDGPRTITSIDLRAFPGAAPSAFFGNSVTLSNIVIRLSTTQRGDEGNTLSANFADNIGADDTIVYSGALTLTTAANGNLPVNPFDYSIVFQNQIPLRPARRKPAARRQHPVECDADECRVRLPHLRYRQCAQ